MIIQLFLSTADGPFPNILFGEFAGRVIIDLDQGHPASLLDSKRKPVPSVAGPRVVGVVSKRYQIPRAGKYWVRMASDELWIRLIARKGQEHYYDLEIGSSNFFDNRFNGKMCIRGLKLSSLTEVSPLAPQEEARTLWDRLGEEADL